MRQSSFVYVRNRKVDAVAFAGALGGFEEIVKLLRKN